MDNDDAQVGRMYTRREVLALFGVAESLGYSLGLHYGNDERKHAPA